MSTPRHRATLLSSLLFASLAVLGSCGGGGGGGGGKRLEALEVTPAGPSLAAGTSTQLVATGIYADSSTADLTEDVTWSSSDTLVAAVDDTPGSRGQAAGAAQGSAQITATLGAVVGETTLTVTSAVLVALEVTPTNPSIALGTNQAFAATGVFSDDSTQDLTDAVAWSSSDTGVATASGAAGQEGVALSVAQGMTTLTATFAAVSGSTELTVTSAVLLALEVDPTNPSIALGTGQVFTATGIFSDGTNQDLSGSATWSSDTVAVATVGGGPTPGSAQSASTGSTMITADVAGISASTTLTVTPAHLVSLAVTPTLSSIPLGLDQTLLATGTFTDGTTQDLSDDVTWSSSDSATVQVSNAAGSRGLAFTLATGDVTVSAVLDGITGSTDLTVTPATLVSIGVTPALPSIALGMKVGLTATGVYTDATTHDLTDVVLWSSTSAGVATISNAAGSAGQATSLSAGSTTITALHSGVSGSITLTVGPATLVSLEVTPSSSDLPLGLTVSFSATGIFTDSTAQDLTGAVTWISSDPAVATVSNAAGSKGLATSVTQGASTVTATVAGIIGSTPLTITPAVMTAIGIVVDSTSVPIGLSEPLIAIGFYSDGSSQDITTAVTWSATDDGVASVSNAAGSQGLLTAAGSGTTSVTASLGGTSESLDITVVAAVLTTLTLTPASPSVPLGIGQQLVATGTFSDASTQDLTAAVSWSSSDPSVGLVSNAPGSFGAFTSLAVGTTMLSAAYSGISDSTTMTVTNATLVSITLTPVAAKLTLGTKRQFTATGNYSDASTQDLTTTVTWSTSSPSVATLSNAAASKGLAQSIAVGTTMVTATLGGVSGSTTLDVVNLTLVSIAITPADTSTARGTSVQYTATGTYNDASTQDLTASVAWSSSSNRVATIGGGGKAKAHRTGTCDIRATLGAVVGMTTLTVVP